MMESSTKRSMVGSVTDQFVNYRVVLAMIMVLCLGCIGDDKPGVFDIVLEEYISYHGLNGEEHYIKVSGDDEMVKDQVGLIV